MSDIEISSMTNKQHAQLTEIILLLSLPIGCKGEKHVYFETTKSRFNPPLQRFFNEFGCIIAVVTAEIPRNPSPFFQQT
jgi:hypothetical protein